MVTDGRRLVYNPAFVEQLTPAELEGVLAHEVTHCALAHHCRRGERDAQLWNQATDYAINPILVSNGMTLPQAGHSARLHRGDESIGLPLGATQPSRYLGRAIPAIRGTERSRRTRDRGGYFRLHRKGSAGAVRRRNHGHQPRRPTRIGPRRLL